MGMDRNRLPTKKYRLISGQHMVPNPDFNAETDVPEASHFVAKEGDVVELNDSQYQTFKHKFAPYDQDSQKNVDQEDNKLVAAKQIAAETKESVDPNQLTQSQVQEAALRAQAAAERAATHKGAAARP